MNGGGILRTGAQDGLDQRQSFRCGGVIAAPPGGHQDLGGQQPKIRRLRSSGFALQHLGGKVTLRSDVLGARITLHHRRGEDFLALGMRRCLRLARDFQSCFQVTIVNVEIHGRPARQRLGPQTHGAVRVCGYGLVKGLAGVAMIEGVIQLDAVIEPLLRRTAGGGDGKATIAHATFNGDALPAFGNLDMLFHAADIEDGEIGFVRNFIHRDSRKGQQPDQA